MKKIFLFIIIFSMMIGPVYGIPYVFDPDFVVEEFIDNVRQPTSIHFINEDMLILEKSGQVRLVRDGVLEPDPVLSVKVNTLNERGLLGITSVNSTVFLYYTETDIDGKLLGNRIYQYEWDGSELTNEVLLHDLPLSKDNPIHNGGAMVKGLDDTVYAVIGDATHRGILQNMEKGNFDDSSVILMVDNTGMNIKPKKSENPDQFYYAIGIRNSFGLAIDPKTGNLWDTENGPDAFDEINLVEPKFNSGWRKVMGPATESTKANMTNYLGFHYSDPEFSWQKPVGPTDLTFVDSEVFKKYEDYLLVGNFHRGEISKFKLNENRNGFIFNDDQLQDKVLNTDEDSDELKFAEGFLGVVSIEFGPDGFLYATSYIENKIYRIIPSDPLNTSETIIPNWFKKNIEYWLADEIDNPTFIAGLKYLIEENILVLSNFYGTEIGPHSLESFKKNAESWKNNVVDDQRFGEDIEFLIGNNLLVLDAEKVRCNSLPTIAIDLSHCNLSGRDFSGLDLSLSNFANTDLSNAKFVQSDLRYADFSNSIMINSNLKSANLYGSNLSKADLTEANLSGVVLKRADASHAILVKANLSKAKMHNIILIGANLEESNLTNAHIPFAKLFGANFNGTNLSGASLEKTSLTNATFENATMDGCLGCPLKIESNNRD